MQGWLLPLFCYALGFWVALLRPDDRRAWILLGTLLSFSTTFARIDVFDWNPLLRAIGTLLSFTLQFTWPLWMLLLGLHFPERLPLRWPYFIAWPAGASILANAGLGTATRFAWLENNAVLPWFAPAFQLTNGPARLLGMAMIGLFFACLGMQYGVAPTPDAKRRAKLLNIGAHLALAPAFILILIGYAKGKPFYEAVPGPVVIAALLTGGLFPLTLAYVVIVHRAMDVRMVLRTGLQYALARRALLFVVLALGGLAAQAPGKLSIALLAGSLLAVHYGLPRAQAWIDRRFFREAYEAEKILADLGDEMRSVANPDEMLSLASRRIAETLHVDNVSFDSPPLPGQVLSRLKANSAPLSVHTLDQASRAQLGSVQLLVPLSGSADIAGVMRLTGKRSEEAYSPADLRLLKSVAAQVGLAIENHRLAGAMAAEMAEREQRNKEMAIARDVQQRLFPHKLPAVPSLEFSGACRPAQSVGGDYYDFIEVPGADLAFAVGDVSGKGMPAALLMAALQASVRGQAMNGVSDLGRFFATVNKLIYDMSPKSHFATLFYGQIESGRLRYGNGGHSPCLLLRAEGEHEWLTPSGPGVGMSVRSRYVEATTALRPGDVLIAYTDGFTEAMNATKEEFGDARLQAVAEQVRTLPVNGILQSIFTAVDAFTAGAPQHDDMTLIAIRVK